jgi:hypothetical protein
MKTNLRQSEQPLTFVLSNFAHQPRWVAWVTEIRNDEPTKVPKNPRTGGNAASNEPTTWDTREAAEKRWHRIRTNHEDAIGGIGIVLGQLPDGLYLLGIDLDGCIDRKQLVADWAQEVLERFCTYSEVSPSGRGIKSFFLMTATDFSKLQRLLGNNEKGKPRTRKSFTAGKHHEVAIDTTRYFTVTDDYQALSSEDLRLVSFEDVEWLVTDLGPRFLRQHRKPTGPTAKAAKPTMTRDESGSG